MFKVRIVQKLNRLRTEVKIFSFALTAFALRAHKLPLWIIAASLFTASVAYIGYFENSRPDEQAEMESGAEKMRSTIAELKALTALDERETEVFLEANKAVEALLHFQLACRSRQANSKMAFDGMKLVLSAKFKVADILGEIRGTEFRSDVLAHFLKGEEKILQGMDGLLDLELKAYLAYLEGNDDTLISELDARQSVSDVLKLEAQVASLKEEYHAMNKTLDIDRQRLVSKAYIFYLKSVLSWLSKIYAAFFLFAVFSGIVGRVPAARVRWKRQQGRVARFGIRGD